MTEYLAIYGLTTTEEKNFDAIIRRWGKVDDFLGGGNGEISGKAARCPWIARKESYPKKKCDVPKRFYEDVFCLFARRR